MPYVFVKKLEAKKTCVIFGELSITSECPSSVFIPQTPANIDPASQIDDFILQFCH